VGVFSLGCNRLAILVAAFCLPLTIFATPAVAAPVVVEVRVGSGLDDVEELPGGHVYSGSSDLELVDAAEGSGQLVGLRFPGLGVPRGAVIVDAWLQFVVDEVSVGPVSLTVRAEAGSAGVFGSGSGVSGRSLTAAAVAWSPPDWGVVGEAGVGQRSPDLSVVVQEVVDGAGWSEAGALGLVISGSGQRIAESFEGGAGVAPLLHLEYVTGGGVVNVAPVVDAGPDVAVVVGGVVEVGGSVSDDGLPVPPGVVVVGWEKVSGPGPVSFGDVGSVVTSVGFSVPGVYVLRLSADDGELVGFDDVTVTVSDGTSSTLTFAAIGDYGDGKAPAGQVADLIASLAAEIIVTTGDNTYGSTNFDDHVGKYYSDYIGDYVGAYGPGSPVNRFFPSLGDSTYDFDGLSDYTDYFTLPGAGIPTSGTAPSERYYDFVQGPIHFFALNSNEQEPDGVTVDSAQAQWLQQALAGSTSPWQVVYFHHPPFSSGGYGEHEYIQWPFEAWGADAVLLGHEHFYERITHDGIPYIITGLGGGGIYDMYQPWPESEFFYNNDYGTLIGVACDTGVTFEFHSISDGLVDTYTMGSSCG
jgi:hypothetical protein